MAYNEKLTIRVREALSNITNVEEKRMFRGVLFMVDGKMCISTGDNELMCRIDPAIHDEVLKRSGCKTTIMKGHAYRGYVYVNEDGMTTEEDFNFWIERSLEFNIIAKASPKKKKQD